MDRTVKSSKAALLAGLVVTCVLAFGVSGVSASVPVYDGTQAFPTVYGPSEPEECSWEVILGEEQELLQINEKEIGFFYSEGLRAGLMQAEPAHDVHGVTVPTTIQVTGEKNFTLIVHHRDGNPAAGGAPFDYPVRIGSGWEGGFVTTVIELPPGEQELREGEEKRCRVPALCGATVAGARRRLVRANCRLGALTRSSGVTRKTGRVVHQSDPGGSSLAQGARVGIKLGPKQP